MHPDEPVATGDRRDEAHYEPDPDQLVRVRFLAKPSTPMPPDMATGSTGPAEPGPPVEDVAVAPDAPSAWDARPADERDGG